MIACDFNHQHFIFSIDTFVTLTCFLNVNTLGTFNFTEEFSCFPAQAILCIPHRYTVQEGGNSVLGVRVSVVAAFSKYLDKCEV